MRKLQSSCAAHLINICALRTQVTYKDRLSFVGSSTEAEWKPIRRTSRSVPSMQNGSQDVEVNETEPTGVVFVMRPPDLRAEPQREEHDQSSDDTKMEQICERIRRLRKEDLSEQSLAFWTALEQVHAKGRRAASVPSLPHTERVGERTFTFEGCPQPLRPLLHDLMRFERPLITWDLFNEAPPAEFRAPGALQLTGPSGEAGSARPAVAHPGITYQPSQPGNAALVPPPLPVAQLDPHDRPVSAAIVEQKATIAQSAGAAGAQSAGASSDAVPGAAQELRDPRIANAVSHAGYPKARMARDAVELGFEEWTNSFPGRVETVAPQRLYIVKLADADGEFRLGLVESQGKVFTCEDEESGEPSPHVKGLWFKRCTESNRAWGANPEFEEYRDASGKRDQDLPTESFLLEVEDSDLTENSVSLKLSKPKLKQALMRKLRWIAQKYNLLVEEKSDSKKAAGKRKRER